ncbi:flagellar export chaperone FliS [Methylibium sp.]|uniref:flagellar export chaperone FliS n=1 Tax=Methylibium sp. TaxID=2067992 RepID=UPI002DB7C0FB|nr:flagellar export chaperone FliS [Methylibium sp.]
MFSPHKSFAGTYQQVQVQTGIEAASGPKLVGMLYDGALEAISTARGAMARGDIELKGRQIARAARIVEEGLLGGLDRDRGGELAANLDRLYRYLARRLTEANLRNDDAALGECAALLAPLRDAWSEIERPA